MTKKTVVFKWKPEKLKLIKSSSVSGLVWAMITILEKLPLRDQAVIWTIAEEGRNADSVERAIAVFEEIASFSRDALKRAQVQPERESVRESVSEKPEQSKVDVEPVEDSQKREELKDSEPSEPKEEEKKELKVNLKFGGKRIQY